MRLALLGVGLIGGSFARAVRVAGGVEHILGFDHDADALARAVELGVIDEAAESAAEAVSEANLVVIATPVGSIRDLLRNIAPRLPASAIITDVGSTKASVIEAARNELGPAFARFVPGHPIAGSEHSGVEYSDATLFRDQVFVSTPIAQTDAGAVDRVETLWRAVGCRIERMTPEEHDKVFAAVSHLPHLLAFALVAQIAAQPDAERKFAMTGAGFRDFTRIAASSPTLWSEICVANRAALGSDLRELRKLLDELQHAVDEGDAEPLQRLFARAAAARRH